MRTKEREFKSRFSPKIIWENLKAIIPEEFACRRIRDGHIRI